MDRRDFIKRLGILIPATASLPGMLISDIRKPIQVPMGMDKRIIQKYLTVDSMGLFSNGKCLVVQPLKGGARCLMDGDVLKVTWTEEFYI